MLLQQEQGHNTSFYMSQGLAQAGAGHPAHAHVDSMVQQQQAPNPNIDMLQLQGFLLQTMQQDQHHQHARHSSSDNAGPNLHELLTGGTPAAPVGRSLWQPASPGSTSYQHPETAEWAPKGLDAAAASGMLYSTNAGDMSWEQGTQDPGKGAAADMPLWQEILLSNPAAQLQKMLPVGNSSSEPAAVTSNRASDGAVNNGSLMAPAQDSWTALHPGKHVLNADMGTAAAAALTGAAPELDILALTGSNSEPRFAGVQQDTQQQQQKVTCGFQVGIPKRASTPQLPIITSQGVLPGSGSAPWGNSTLLPGTLPTTVPLGANSGMPGAKPTGSQTIGQGTAGASPGLPPLSAAMLQQLVGNNRTASPGVGITEVTPVNRPGRKPQQAGSDSDTSYVSNVQDSSGSQPAARQGGRVARGERPSKLANMSHATDSAPPAPARGGRTAREPAAHAPAAEPQQLQVLERDNSHALAAALAAVNVVAAGGRNNPPGRHDMLGMGVPRSCHCKKSQCLKLYCDCFSAGVWCWNCACTDCYNRPQYKAKVIERREHIMSRDPKAFVRKIQTDGAAGQERHKKGCNCKRSHCLKKYCECYQGGVRCSISCKCTDCHNHEGSLLPVASAAARTSGRRAPTRVMDYQTTWFDELQATEEAPVRKSTRARKTSRAAAAAAATEWEYDEAADDSDAGGAGGDVRDAEGSEEAPTVDMANVTLPATWSGLPAVALPVVAPHLSPSLEEPAQSTQQAAKGPGGQQDDLLLAGQAGWAGALPGISSPSTELRRILDQAGLPTTPTGLFKTGQFKGAVGAAGGDDQQLLLLQQLNATPSTLRYPHTLGNQAATGSGASAGAGGYGSVIGGFVVGGAGSRATGSGSGATGGEEVEDPKREGHTAALPGLNGSAPAVQVAPAGSGPEVATGQPLGSAFKSLHSASSPPGAMRNAPQAGAQQLPAQAQDEGMNAIGNSQAAAAGLEALGGDADEAILRAPSEELGDEDDADMELGSAVWSHAFSRFASTPGGVARLLASPCRTTFSLGSPLPPPDLLFPRPTPSSHTLGWPQDLLLTPSSRPLPPDVTLSSSTASKQHQGVVGSVEALVTPVRTGRNRGPTTGVKRTLGVMMGESQAAASGIPVPSPPGLDALASLAAAEAGIQAQGSQQEPQPAGCHANGTITTGMKPPAAQAGTAGKGSDNGNNGGNNNHIGTGTAAAHNVPRAAVDGTASSQAVQVTGHKWPSSGAHAGQGSAAGQVSETDATEKGTAVQGTTDAQLGGATGLPGGNPTEQLHGSGRKRLQTAGGSGDFAGRVQGAPPTLETVNSGGGFGQLQPPAMGNGSLIVGHVQFGGAANAAREARISSSLEALKAQASDYINSRLRAPDRKSPAAAPRNQPPVIPVPPPSHPVPTPPCRQNSLTSSSLGLPAAAQTQTQAMSGLGPDGQAVHSQPMQGVESSAAARELSLQQLPENGSVDLHAQTHAGHGAVGRSDEQPQQQQQQQVGAAAGKQGATGAGVASLNGGVAAAKEGSQPSAFANGPSNAEGASGPNGMPHASSLMAGSSLPMCGTPWTFSGLLDGANMDAFLMSPGASGGFAIWDSLLGSPMMTTPAHAKQLGLSASFLGLSPMRGCRLFANEVAGPEASAQPTLSTVVAARPSNGTSSGSKGSAGAPAAGSEPQGVSTGAGALSAGAGAVSTGAGGAGINRVPRPHQVTSSGPGMPHQHPPPRHANSSVTSAPLEGGLAARPGSSSTPGLVLPGNGTPGVLSSGSSSQLVRITPGKTLVAPTGQLPALSPSNQLPAHGTSTTTLGGGVSLLQRQHSSSRPTQPA